jgi:hypothetical protein
MMAVHGELIYTSVLRRGAMGNRDHQASALKTLGYCVRAYSPWFAMIESTRLDASEAERLRLHIDSLAAKLEGLAELVPEGRVTYREVEAIITELHDVGFYPARLAVKSVENAFAQED